MADPGTLLLSLHSQDASTSGSSSTANRSLRVAENERRKAERQPLQEALLYLSRVQEGTVVRGNDTLERHLVVVETVALSRGLPPEAITSMLDLALSLRAGSGVCTRILKFLIPSSVVPQDGILRGVSWLCVGKIPQAAQLLFLRWILTMFDLIERKDDLRAVYGLIFSFVTDENLCPFICHLLYLLTMKEHVQPYRVRKLLEVQNRMGRQPFLMQLLALYKVFRPELVTLSVPSRLKAGFKNYNSTWKVSLSTVQKKNRAELTADLTLSLQVRERSAAKRRKLRHLEVPSLSSALEPESNRMVFRLQELQSFNQLLQNIHNIELPAQMGSLLGSSLALHYLDCVQDESAFLRLNFWLGQSLQEEFLLCSLDGGTDSLSEASQFLSTVLSSQQFLQEGFFSTESFLYKLLNVWDGTLLRQQILDLLSHIPLMPCHYMKVLLFEPLMQLYFTSSVFFKCSVIECLNNMLTKWLTWHSVNVQGDGLGLSPHDSNTLSMHQSGFKETVTELVHFVGRLASEGLRLENCHVLLLNHVLTFYETVCDMLMKYGLPVVIMPPAGVFCPALLAADALSVDRLGYIMYRYRKNLSLAKKQEHQSEQSFHIQRSTYQEFNKQLVGMVSSLWNSKTFSPGTAIEVDERRLTQSQVSDYWSRYDLVYHPAFFRYAIEFHQKCWPGRSMNLSSIKVGRFWTWYVEFLFSQGFVGLHHFIQVNAGQSSSSSSS